MDITITVYYNVGADVTKAQKLQEKLNEIAIKSELVANIDNGNHVLSHSYFHETFRTTKTKARDFAKKVRKIDGIDKVVIKIDDKIIK